MHCGHGREGPLARHCWNLGDLLWLECVCIHMCAASEDAMEPSVDSGGWFVAWCCIAPSASSSEKPSQGGLATALTKQTIAWFEADFVPPALPAMVCGAAFITAGQLKISTGTFEKTAVQLLRVGR